MSDDFDIEETLAMDDGDATLPLHALEQTQPLDRAVDDPAATTGADRLEKLAAQSNADGRYEVLGEVGRGGMGAVLKVVDGDLRRTLAMKVILDRSSGSTVPDDVPAKVLDRFVEEAQVTGQLDHPGVVPVHELGVDEQGRAYFTMPLVRGRELKDVIRDVHLDGNDWSMTRAIGVVLKVCEAMSYAHDKGVVHRDLKPANVMVGEYGEVYVMDWGLARVLSSDPDPDRPVSTSAAGSPQRVQTDREESAISALQTMDGAIMGTPCYMAPEQAMGKAREVGPASDVYAVGAILYHLLTGQRPYVDRKRTTSVQDILALARSEPPVPVEKLAPSTSPELVAICEHSMQREPADRYRDMGALAADLRAFLEGRVVQAHRTGPVAELKKWMQRNKALATTLCVSSALILVGSIASAAVFRDQRDRAVTAEGNASVQATLAKAARDDAVVARDDARRRLVLSHSERGARGHASSDSGGAAIWFAEALRGTEGMPELAELQRRRLAAVLADAPEPRMIARTEYSTNFSALSPDGERLITNDAGGCSLWDADDGRELARIPFARGHLSPDGKYIGLLSHIEPADENGELPRTQLGLADGNSGQFLAETAVVTGEAIWHGFAGAGPSFFVELDTWEGEYHELLLWDGVTREAAPGDPLRITERETLRRTPDGQVAVVRGTAYGHPDALTVFHPSDGGQLRHIEHPSPVEHVALADDGRSTVTAWGSEARVWNTATGKPFSVPLDHGAKIDFLRYAPEAGLVMTASATSAEEDPEQPYLVRVWNVTPGADLEPMVVEHSGDIHALEFTEDGDRLISITRQTSTHADGTKREFHLACAIEANTGELLAVGRIPARPGSRLGWRGSLPDGRILTTHQIDRPSYIENETAVTAWDPRDPTFDPTTYVFGGLEGKAEFDASCGRAVINPPYDSMSTQRRRFAQVLDLRSSSPLTLRVDPEPAASSQTSPARRVHAVRPDGEQMATIGADASITMVDLITGDVVKRYARPTDARITCMVYGPNGETLLIGGADGTLRILDEGTGERLLVEGPDQAEMVDAALSPDGNLAWARWSNGDGQLIDVDSGDVRAEWGKTIDRGGFLDTSVVDVEFDPDGEHVLVVCATGWFVAPCQPGAESDGGFERASDYRMRYDAGAFSPDGELVAVANGDDGTGDVRLHDPVTQEPVGRLMQHGARVTEVAFSPGGELIATGSQDGTARLWNARSGEPAGPPLRHDAPVHGLRFNADGTLLATIDDQGELCLWSTYDSEPVPGVGEYHGGHRVDQRFIDMEFLPGGNRLVTLPADTVQPSVWDLSPDGRSVEYLTLAAECLGRRRVNDLGSMSDLTEDELAERLERMWALGYAERTR